MKKKVLFIDRDGTLVIEPPVDLQLDSFQKLEFYPKIFQYLSKISSLGYELAMVTNQDGLGTGSFPEDTFWPVQHFIIQSFRNEGVVFEDVYIDRTFPQDNAPSRKPGTAMLTKYINNPEYDLQNSYVIGDRLTDVQLAANLGAKAILIADASKPTDGLENSIALKTTDWKDIYEFLLGFRQVDVRRKTKETDIAVNLFLDGTGYADIKTGLNFFDHMLEQVARHGQLDLRIRAKGDLQVDEHHTIEDTAIVLGEAFHQALGNKTGIERYGFCLPMDDAFAQVAIDFGGRSWLVWQADFQREKIGDVPTEMFEHFFKSFCDSARANLNIRAEGKNEHHKIEAIFKAFAKAIKMAIKRDTEKLVLPSTKGAL